MTFFFCFPPQKPFEEFKWKWASLQCTESINDPVILLGVLERMRKLEKLNHDITYSSEEFASELRALENDIRGHGISINLAERVGERNLIRNSGQYWKALGLIPNTRRGRIELTDFGRMVADRLISQTEFAAYTIRTFTLPNPAIQSEDECAEWREHGLKIRPLSLLLHLMHELAVNPGDAYLTKDELIRIVIPLSGDTNSTIERYKETILAYRRGELDISDWPNCCPRDNDHRIAREFLLFLSYHGYMEQADVDGEERFIYNALLDEDVLGIIGEATGSRWADIIRSIQASATNIDRKRVQFARTRPNQARFRPKVVLQHPRCVITNVTMPEILEAAHIVPYKYNGADTLDNGFAMRMDIHMLFDTGHLRIRDDGMVYLSERARMDYGALIPPRIDIPDFINREYVRWRWENYHGI